ncbi:MAG: hypothetical protein JNM25_19985 [Planctomycetes bacterium]|nr:hypothetical protein [Planctomycetota bacterium]
MSNRTVRRVSLGVALLLAAATLPAQNSTRKIRNAPSELAARAGGGVPWRDDVEAALVEAKRDGKPVFWYVPSVARSPMDRKAEIDRYLMGGPFSWPSTIELLTEHFVPVKQVASGARANELGLVHGTFLEPGYVVLDGDGVVKAKLDQVTTFHPQWFETPLRRLVGQPLERFPCSVTAAEAWRRLQAGDLAAAFGALEVAAPYSPGDGPEGRWLLGVLQFRAGQRSAAIATWRALASEAKDSPWGWKAALEVEGHGPFVHGFEVYGELPAAVLATTPSDGSRAPEGTYTEPELWQRSVAFLSTMADDDGVYRDSIYDFGGTDGLPNVHAAVTCLVGEALLAARARVDAGTLTLPEAVAARVDTLLLQLRDNALAEGWLALSDRDEILWARAYALRFLLAWQRHRVADAGTVDPGIRSAIAALIALQPDTGVWFHEYGNPFAIATALQALACARAQGFEVPQDTVDKGLRALAMNRTDKGAFTYGQTRAGRAPRESVEAAAGRMPLCELGLYLHGGSDQARLLASVEAGLQHHGLLAAVRKYDDHADRLHYGGFFFWFDMLGRSEAIAALTDADARHRLAAQQHELILKLPEFDGCFVDSHELGRCYGTAMALLCLDTLARAAR